MSTEVYNSILEQIRQLSFDEQLQLLEDMIRIIRRQATVKPQHSFLELRGLGKETWEAIDVDQYIENERNSWE
jgi:hypothetical protein